MLPYNIPQPTRMPPSPPKPRVDYKKLYLQEKAKTEYYKGKLAEIRKIVE